MHQKVCVSFDDGLVWSGGKAKWLSAREFQHLQVKSFQIPQSLSFYFIIKPTFYSR